MRNSDIDTVFVLIPEVEPEHFWQRVLQNHRGALLAHALRKNTDAVVCRLRLRIPDKAPETDVAPKLVSISHSARPDTTAAAGVITRMTEDPYA